VHRGQVLGDVDDDPAAGVAEALDGLSDDPVDADLDLHQVQRADLQSAHVEQVGDEVVEPVGLLGDGLQQLLTSGGGEMAVGVA